jgi:hypothetical protein
MRHECVHLVQIALDWVVRQHVPFITPGVLTRVTQIFHPQLVERQPTQTLFRKRTQVLGRWFLAVWLRADEGRNDACALRLRASVEPVRVNSSYRNLRARARVCVRWAFAPGEEAAKVAASAWAEEKRHHQDQSV